MKILYGVQGTGNGHITRARVMARALAQVGAEVDWVFSGRAREDLFDMAAFGDFRLYKGLTFSVKRSRIQYVKTLLQSDLRSLRREINSLDVEGYDLIINDFEPVSAWAAGKAKKEVIGISHQNAFLYDIPKRGDNFLTAWFMRYFAPVTLPIGLHWHHFNQPILPPLVEPSPFPNQPRFNQYLVYLPFSEPEDIVRQLKRFPQYKFFVYQKISAPQDHDHIHLRPFSRDGFQKDLHQCEGVICSAGFELLSEAIQLGKKLLVCPLAGQMEQYSNALALHQLGYGSVATRLDNKTIAAWLPLPRPKQVLFPDVATELAAWLITGNRDLPALSRKLWEGMSKLERSSAFGGLISSQCGNGFS
ncbi:MJ1255/VC2487 family glycosyltransferase [Marinimicrobium sp. ABcell2]|uniref:MJ1255/VC2487 family glycosyltransferase n=1 Tax=Marinimicrobium sp. ABcell2 TaxID=3069751 RepID=UPI0027AE22DC|nr:MJ1255/VC2487 family glycosyltransferase [Marinimicrobium sp. ABcell2]MDQ2075282.1 glycosyltransferase family protein [Marinimicrobium sp. ABcell2]